MTYGPNIYKYKLHQGDQLGGGLNYFCTLSRMELHWPADPLRKNYIIFFSSRFHTSIFFKDFKGRIWREKNRLS